MALIAASSPPKPTSHRPASDDEGELFARWQQRDDEAAREALVRRYLPLANRLARRYMHSSEPFEDLQQVASLGLLKALDRFDPSRGRPFQSFAVPTMLGEIRRYFRDSGWSMHVPRGVQELALKVRDAQEAFANEHGRAPTVNQLAVYLELGVEEVIDAVIAMQGYKTLSLDAPRAAGEREDAAINYGEAIGDEDERYELVELDATVTAVLDHIPPRQRRILHMRFVEDLTQTEIAARVGISQMQVSRLLRRSLEELRALTGERP